MYGRNVNMCVRVLSNCVFAFSAPTVNIYIHKFHSAQCFHYCRIHYSVWNKAMDALRLEGKLNCPGPRFLITVRQNELEDKAP